MLVKRMGELETGINRNIVECKVRPAFSTIEIVSVLIETLWNVKVSSQSFKCASDLVLIETLWNVKVQTGFYRLYHVLVLIETLWNVKLYKLCLFRYMCFQY